MRLQSSLVGRTISIGHAGRHALIGPMPWASWSERAGESASPQAQTLFLEAMAPIIAAHGLVDEPQRAT
jgi:hypothetical protein